MLFLFILSHFRFLIGAPGTGKTAVLIEATVQILKHKPNDKILICASSNSSCDQIANKLLNLGVKKNKVLRYYSEHVVKGSSKIDEKLLATSNLRNQEYNDLTFEELSWFQVVVTTLVCSHRLARSNLEHRIKFQHIFIDEAVSTIECETIIPIFAFGNLKNVENCANVVLSGDLKQLGPVVFTEIAKHYLLSK
jgi:helicase MOV-10